MANEWPTNTQRIPKYMNFHHASILSLSCKVRFIIARVATAIVQLAQVISTLAARVPYTAKTARQSNWHRDLNGARTISHDARKITIRIA